MLHVCFIFLQTTPAGPTAVSGHQKNQKKKVGNKRKIDFSASDYVFKRKNRVNAAAPSVTHALATYMNPSLVKVRDRSERDSCFAMDYPKQVNKFFVFEDLL